MTSKRKAIVATLLGLGILGFVAFVSLAVTLPDGTTLKTKYPVIKVLAETNQFRIEWSATRPPQWARLDEISTAARNAVMISEDWAFYDHNGLDENQILEVLEDSLKRKRVRGASTISQQVAKNLYLSSERTLWRKFREVLLTFQLEAHCSKDRILETYLNIAEWGEDLYGITGAARLYFKKTPADLSAREGAFLAMLLPSPKRYSKSFRERSLTPYALKMMNGILLKMLQAHFLTQEEYDRALGERFEFEEGTFTSGESAAREARTPLRASVAPKGQRALSSEKRQTKPQQSPPRPSKSRAPGAQTRPGQSASKPRSH